MAMIDLEALLRRDRRIVLAGLAALTLLAWAYTLWLALGMEVGAMAPTMAMPSLRAWTAVDLALMLLMWVAMMVAMMTPSAAPMVLLYAAICRRRVGFGGAVAPALFLSGYLAVWGGFSLLATGLQWALHDAALLSDAMGRLAPVFGGALLIAAGIYQFSALKRRCLSHCRSPLQFLSTGWRPGAAGGFAMGVRHGLYCLGCCWLLMGILFAAGIMNLLWIAAIALLVMAEKLLPQGIWVGRLVGVALACWGLWVAVWQTSAH